MQTKAALDFINALIKAGKSQQVVNAVLNGTCALGEDAEFCGTATRDLFKSLTESKAFTNMLNAIVLAARRGYHLGGISFEGIVGAVLVGGFVAGTQFALDGGKAEHTHGGPDHEHKSPTTLVN